MGTVAKQNLHQFRRALLAVPWILIAGVFHAGADSLLDPIFGQWRNLLEAGDIKQLVSKAGKTLPSSPKAKKSLRKELGYFENNASCMRYAEYREKDFFVGSGVVEAGCRTVIGVRLKQSGMRWSVRGANAIIALSLLHHVRTV